MQTIRTKTIQDKKIIIGFDKLPIDGKKTIETCAQMIEGTKEKQDVDQKIREHELEKAKARGFATQAGAIFKYVAEDLKKKDPQIVLSRDTVLNAMIPELKKELLGKEQSMRDHLGVANIKETELKGLSLILGEKSKDIRRSNPVYGEPQANREARTDADIEELREKLVAKTENQQLLSDGEYIDDFRGKFYNKKVDETWNRVPLTGLGVTKPAGSKWDGELTEEEKLEIGTQNENERLAGLTPEDKAAEKQARLDSVLQASINMRSGLEIAGDPDALTKAQDWYNAEVVKINDKYGV